MLENAQKFAFIKQRILSWEFVGIANIYDFHHLYKSAYINSLTDICLQNNLNKHFESIAWQY